MTDNDMLTAVRDCLITARDRVAGEQMVRPAGAIISRARRRRLRQGLNTAAAAAVIIAAAFALLPGSTDPGATRASLAAWTVITKPGGQLSVTIRELRDPAGLQRRLRADGIPATIRFTNQLPRPCQYDRLPARQVFRLLSRIFPQSTHASGQTAFTVNPPAIPARTGLWINVSPPARHGPDNAGFSASWTLVYANGRCPPGQAGGAAGGGVAGGGSGN